MFSGSNLESGALAISDKMVKQMPSTSLKAYQTSQFSSMKIQEREELKNVQRNLKVTLNLVSDENLRLRTRL